MFDSRGGEGKGIQINERVGFLRDSVQGYDPGPGLEAAGRRGKKSFLEFVFFRFLIEMFRS